LHACLPLARVHSSCSRSHSRALPFLCVRPLSLSLECLSLSLSLALAHSRACSLLSFSLSLSLSLSSQHRVRPLRRSCPVSRWVPSAIVPPLQPAIAPRLVASAAPRRVACRLHGVYTPPRWEQIGSIPATIYPRVRVQLPSRAGHGLRHCNRSMRGAPCCNRSQETPGASQKRGTAAERQRKRGERLGPAKAKGCGKRR